MLNKAELNTEICQDGLTISPFLKAMEYVAGAHFAGLAGKAKAT